MITWEDVPAPSLGLILIKMFFPLSFYLLFIKVDRAPMFKVTPLLKAYSNSFGEMKFYVYMISSGLKPHWRALCTSPGETTSTWWIPRLLMSLTMVELVFALSAYLMSNPSAALIWSFYLVTDDLFTVDVERRLMFL